jgi:hypothetical protein
VTSAVTSASRLLELDRITHEVGFSFVCELPANVSGDTEQTPAISGAEVFEDGKSLGPPHTEHELIRTLGRGRYSHWGRHLYFSTSDNSDPRTNRRSYRLYVPAKGRNTGPSGVQALLERAHAGLTPWEAYGVAEALFYQVFPRGFIGEFGKACWQDERFVSDYERLVSGNRRSFERKYVVSQLVRSLKYVPGDIAECGVYNGATAYFMAKATREAGVSRSVHLFDSFSGLSRPAAEDGTYWHEGALAIPEATARQNLASFPGVTFYAGWIPERFPEIANREFAFVHIDVDLYEPTRDSMQFFYSRVSRGGMIVCDDYGFTTCPGARKALLEFMSDKPEEIIELPTGQGLIVRG